MGHNAILYNCGVIKANTSTIIGNTYFVSLDKYLMQTTVSQYANTNGSNNTAL